MRTVIGHMVGPGDARTQLNLVRYRTDRGFRKEPIQMGRFEVGNANRPGLAGRVQLLERFPSGDIFVALRQRPVNQEQVNILQVKLP